MKYKKYLKESIKDFIDNWDTENLNFLLMYNYDVENHIDDLFKKSIKEEDITIIDKLISRYPQINLNDYLKYSVVKNKKAAVSYLLNKHVNVHYDNNCIINNCNHYDMRDYLLNHSNTQFIPFFAKRDIALTYTDLKIGLISLSILNFIWIIFN